MITLKEKFEQAGLTQSAGFREMAKELVDASEAISRYADLVAESLPGAVGMVAKTLFEHHGGAAKNWTSLVVEGDGEQYVMTFRRMDGKSPEEMVTVLKGRVDELEALLLDRVCDGEGNR